MKEIRMSFPSLPPLEEYIDEIRSLWTTGQITNIGEKVHSLENEIALYLGVPYATVFTNGHTALEIALEVLELQGEVITTPYTFVSTTLAILRRGLHPVFCDIKEDFTINEEQVEAAITDKTCAILPVHVYGNLCNHKKLMEISERYNIPIIYDAAHAFGVEENGRGIGGFGKISMFSFHATKIFNTVEGGVLTYSDISLKRKLEEIRNFGLYRGEPVSVGTNAKMSEIHAAMGLCNLRYLEEEIEKRKMLTQLYNQMLGGCEGIILNQIPHDVKYNYAYYPIRIIQKSRKESRDDVFKRLEANKIYARKYYSPLMTQLLFVNNNSKRTCMVAQELVDEVITLPLNSRMEEDDVKRVCQVIKN